jgi:hypothetical protein
MRAGAVSRGHYGVPSETRNPKKRSRTVGRRVIQVGVQSPTRRPALTDGGETTTERRDWRHGGETPSPRSVRPQCWRSKQALG